jgi:hypothetical protein
LLAGTTSQIVAFILEHAHRNGYHPRLTAPPGQTAASSEVA